MGSHVSALIGRCFFLLFFLFLLFQRIIQEILVLQVMEKCLVLSIEELEVLITRTWAASKVGAGVAMKAAPRTSRYLNSQRNIEADRECKARHTSATRRTKQQQTTYNFVTRLRPTQTLAPEATTTKYTSQCCRRLQRPRFTQKDNSTLKTCFSEYQWRHLLLLTTIVFYTLSCLPLLLCHCKPATPPKTSYTPPPYNHPLHRHPLQPSPQAPPLFPDSTATGQNLKAQPERCTQQPTSPPHLSSNADSPPTTPLETPTTHIRYCSTLCYKPPTCCNLDTTPETAHTKQIQHTSIQLRRLLTQNPSHTVPPRIKNKSKRLTEHHTAAPCMDTPYYAKSIFDRSSCIRYPPHTNVTPPPAHLSSPRVHPSHIHTNMLHTICQTQIQKTSMTPPHNKPYAAHTHNQQPPSTQSTTRLSPSTILTKTYDHTKHPPPTTHIHTTLDPLLSSALPSQLHQKQKVTHITPQLLLTHPYTHPLAYTPSPPTQTHIHTLTSATFQQFCHITSPSNSTQLTSLPLYLSKGMPHLLNIRLQVEEAPHEFSSSHHRKVPASTSRYTQLTTA